MGTAFGGIPASAPTADGCPDLSALDLAPEDAGRPVAIGGSDTMLPPVEIKFVDKSGHVAALYGWGRLAAHLREESADPRRDYFEADFIAWVTEIKDPAAPRVPIEGIIVKAQAGGYDILPRKGNHVDRVWLPLRKRGDPKSRHRLEVPARICLRREFEMRGFVYRSPGWECAPTGG